MKIYLVFYILLLEKALRNTIENKNNNIRLLEEKEKYKIKAILDY
jgi:hypothetical protein